MRLQDKTNIEVTGYEVATALGCLRYICDYKYLGSEVQHLKSLIEKLEQARDKEL